MAEIYVDRRQAPVNINLRHEISPSRGQRIFGIIFPPYARLFFLMFTLAAKSGRQERAIAPFFGAAHVVWESHGGDLC
jgi:hypothetical protein